MLGLVFCGLNGKIFEVCFSNGSECDQGLYNKAGFFQKLKEKEIRVLADRGFDRDSQLIVPIGNPYNNSFIDKVNKIQYQFRAVVETVFSRVKNWKVTDYKYKQSVTSQIYALDIVFQMVSSIINENPLRTSYFFEENKADLAILNAAHL